MRTVTNGTALLICLGWACSSGTEVRVQPCTAANSTTLGILPVGAYTSIAPSADGCVQFTANALGDTIEYVVVVQSVSGGPNRSAQFRLAGEALMAAPASFLAVARQAEPPSPVEQFHTMLREREAAAALEPRPPGAPLQLNATATPPTVGDIRNFKVCSTLTCAPPMVDVSGIAKAVGQKVAVYVDATAQSSVSQADLDSLVTVFDQRIFALDEAAFGEASDRDQNGVVMVLMTPQINRLVTAQQCVTSGFVAGYFFGNDLAPSRDLDVNSNHGELFYTIVPDPTGVYSCSHSVARVRQLTPVVFVHELQHMISFNYHVLIPNASTGRTEVLWLNEALSHYAEELGGRTYLPGDNATFSSYLSGNVRNAYTYMSGTGEHYLVAIFGSGTLGERGAGWLFIRYLVDQMAADTTMAAWHTVTRALVQTTEIGTANIEALTGMTFEQTVSRWGLALWVSDLPGFTAPPELRYRSWAFRTTYAALYPSVFARPYPLEPPVTLGADVDMTGNLRSGSGVYGRVLHPPAVGSFTLQLAGADGTAVSPDVEPRLTVIRVR